MKAQINYLITPEDMKLSYKIKSVESDSTQIKKLNSFEMRQIIGGDNRGSEADSGGMELDK